MCYTWKSSPVNGNLVQVITYENLKLIIEIQVGHIGYFNEGYFETMVLDEYYVIDEYGAILGVNNCTLQVFIK